MYDNDKMVDLTYGVNYQVLAIAQVLANRAPDFAEYSEWHYQVMFNTYRWYNCREQGICLSMSPNPFSKPVLNIAIFEHRNSDEICCLKWETDHLYMNSPLEDKDIYQKAYHGGDKFDVAASFKYLEIGKCVDWIYNEFDLFYQAHHKAAEKKIEVSK